MTPDLNENINELSKCLLLVDIALQFSHDKKFTESVLKTLKNRLKQTKTVLSKTTWTVENLLQIITIANDKE